MNLKSIIVREFGPPQTVDLTPEEIRQLLEYSKGAKERLGLPSAPFELAPSGPHWEISARHVTGFIQIGSIYVEVRPKFLELNTIDDGSWRAALINLVLLAMDELPIDGTTSASLFTTMPVPDILAESLIRSLHRGSQRGLPRGYRESTETLSFISGRLDFRRAIELFRTPPRVPVIRDELTENILVNRLLKWAASTLASLVVSSRRGAVLRELASGFDCDAYQPSVVEARRITIGPQHKPLKAAIQVARVLLEQSSLLHSDTGPETPGLLWNSADIFERLVFKVVRRAVGSSNLRASKNMERFGQPVGSGAVLHMTPDIQLRRRGVAQAVLDAKYKTFDQVPSSKDVYQVIAAGKVLDCDNVALVYPGNEVKMLRWELRGQGNPSGLGAITLDISLLATPLGLRRLGDSMSQFLEQLLPEPARAAAS